MRRRWWFVLAVVLQAAVLITMIGMKWSTLTYGTKIMLETAPVDPWDLFRGDYVVLNYKISELNLQELPSDGTEFKTNDTVYVSLQQQGKYWEPVSVSAKLPSDGTLAIKGLVNFYNSFEKRLFVRYGVDSYYVPQHKGRELERERQSFEVEVSVDRRGNSALSRLFIAGEEVDFQ